MREIKETCYKGTRILVGNEKRRLINKCAEYLIEIGFEEISIPAIQFQETFTGKVGEENNNLMFNFADRKERQICLAPEYTAVVQKLAQTTYKFQKDVKLFYVQECFRGERQQYGRWRQFTQLGVEILNPTDKFNNIILSQMAAELITFSSIGLWQVNLNTTRGLDYYKEGQGFEIIAESLGTAKQICGGGEYENGIGFAIGVDRLLLEDASR